MTTKGSWGAHVKKYESDFGEGIKLLYERGKGIVGRFKMPQIGGTAAAGAQGVHAVNQAEQ